MRRRQVLKTLAAGSAISIGAGTAAGRWIGGPTALEQVEAVHVVRGGETVGTLLNPT